MTDLATLRAMLVEAKEERARLAEEARPDMEALDLNPRHRSVAYDRFLGACRSVLSIQTMIADLEEQSDG